MSLSALAGLDDECLATQRDLSPVGERLLARLVAESANEPASDPRQADLPEWVRDYPYAQQPWPTLVGAAKRARLESATVALVELLRKVPERVFGGDPRAMASFYGLDPTLVALAVEPPNGLEAGIARCDLIDDGERILGLEVNLGAYLGGWQLRFWERWSRSLPAVRGLCEQEGIGLRFRDPLEALFEHVAATARDAGTAGPGAPLHTALVVDEEQRTLAERAQRHLQQVYDGALAAVAAGEGRLHLGQYPDGLSRRGDLLTCGGEAVQAVIEYTHAPTPPDVFRAFKRGSISLFNPPIYRLLGDKRTLALLSMHDTSDRFTREERELIRQHVPWSRPVRRGATSFRGREEEMADLLHEGRDGLVLKRGLGSRGEQVVIGPCSAPADWEAAVGRALAEEGRWLAQEFVASRPYLYRLDAGVCPHDMVWGLFCFGRSYGGGFLRMVPCGTGDGIINAARGAREGTILEVIEDAGHRSPAA